MRKAFSIAVVIMCAAVSISAQNKTVQRHHSEDKDIAVKTNTAVTDTGDEAFYPRTSYSYAVEDFRPGVVRVGPRTTYLKEGLRTEEVVRLLGKPAAISERNEHGVIITIYEFDRGEGRTLIADFVGGVLVRSRTETRQKQAVQADR
jgi:hypothetical protein